MNRREFVRSLLGGLVLLAGCLGQDSRTPIEVQNRTSRVVTRNCTDSREHTSSLSVRTQEVAVEASGRIPTAQPCLGISTSASATVSDEPEELIIHVFTEEVDDQTCDSCPAEVMYQATYETDRLPEYVQIRHYPNGRGTDFEYSARHAISDESSKFSGESSH